MGLFLVIGIILIIGIVLLILGDRQCWDAAEFIGGALTFLSSFALVIMVIVLICTPHNIQRLENDYNNTQVLIESYQGFDYGNAIPLTEHMLFINDKIAKHKTYANTWWVGCYHSEKVGNLEPLKLKNVYEIYE